MDGEESAAAAREVFDVAVPAVFGAAGDRARAFLADFGFEVGGGGAGVDVVGLRGLCDDALEGGGFDEVGFAGVPGGEDGGAGGTAEDAWVDEPGEADAWYVARRCVYSFKVL